MGTVGRDPSIEALDDQHALAAECGDFGMRSGQAKSLENPQTQPFVVHRGREVRLTATDQAQGQLEDVGGGGSAARLHPLAVPLKESILFLCTCQGDAEIVVRIRRTAKTFRADRLQQVAFNGLFVQHHPIDAFDVGGQFPFREQLQCSDAIAPDG